MNKNYTTAPLPFQGQKRRFIKEFRKVLLNHQPKIVVDLFGGSALLSYTSKRVLPNATVVYNDFDDYHLRLQNVDTTNRILSDIRQIVKGCPDDLRIPEKESKLIIKRLEKEFGFVDWITLSASLLFPMKYGLCLSDFKKQILYNRIKQTDYVVTGYLDGLQVVKTDYYDLFLKYQDAPGVLFVVDPPYLSTNTSTYNSVDYWKLKDYLNVLRVLDGSDYVFFTSNKSSIIELLEWIENTYQIKSLFTGATILTADVQLNYSSKYTDMMLYRFNKYKNNYLLAA